MKVLYIAGFYSLKYGGFEKYTIELLKQGVDLSIVYNDFPSSQEYLKDLESLDARLYTVQGNLLKRVFQVYKVIKKEKPDIVHYHLGFLPFFLFLIVKILFPRTKQVLTQHCEFLYHGIGWLLLTKICYNSLDGILSVSKAVKDGMIKKIGNSSHFIVHYLGVAKEKVSNYNLRNELAITKDELVFTSIGFDIDVKGFDLLAQAISILKKENSLPPFKVIIIGLCESEHEKFQKIIEELQVKDDFISVGIRNDVDDFLYFTDVYIQSSRTEAISLSIMEALLYGIPVIGAEVGGIPEVCVPKRNGELFEKGNVEQLALAIRKLLNKDLRTTYGQKSLEISRMFDRANSVQELISYYKKILH